MGDDKITNLISQKKVKEPLFQDNGPLIKVQSLNPKIHGFEDDIDDNVLLKKREFEKFKNKKKRMEKKMVRELKEDARTLEQDRRNYGEKLDKQKQKIYQN